MGMPDVELQTIADRVLVHYQKTSKINLAFHWQSCQIGVTDIFKIRSVKGDIVL